MTNIELIYLSALRYAIGRRTYMPGVVAEEIKKACDRTYLRFTYKAAKQAVKEISEAEVRNDLGADYDAETWRELRSWLLERFPPNE